MPALAENRKARFNYDILETFEAGLVLAGHEVKSAKKGQANIQGSHVIIRGDEAYIIGMHIPPYQEANTPDGYEPDHTRKLLLTKKEIGYLGGKITEKRLTIVPLRVYTKHGLVKLDIGLGKGKKKADKRQTIKARETSRKIERTLKGDA